ncbi:hypothetical protein [Paenibacillus sp. MER 99-2]|uniref:hypothetical protein n=1 Tax=Paenibacillus sp. MER 99-2 TaxID=2939572 RepID=UPI0020422EEE|nr:hypothetical protein [Paenibacillus sp. MER 99-2]MCM3175924.1 hypothetical protein [Paenibacillus sp. MER 99-2]
MRFSLNANKMLLGIGDTYRLKKNSAWVKQRDFKHFDETDLLFNSYSSAQLWLQQNSQVNIDGKTVLTMEDSDGVHNLLDFDKINFEIILHRTDVPANPIFSKEELRNVLLHGNEEHDNALIIDFDGYLKLVPLIDRSARTLTEYAVRFNTFDAGNGYVGANSNLFHLDNTYTILLEAWLLHLISGRELYSDGRMGEESVEEIISEINGQLDILRERGQALQ